MNAILDIALGVFIGHFGWNLVVMAYNKLMGKKTVVIGVTTTSTNK